jgi:hypothetical protein
MIDKSESLRSRKHPCYEIYDTLQTQGGGHGKIRLGFADCPCIAKPFMQREDEFYRRIRDMPLVAVIPLYHGFYQNWLFLQDLTAGMSSPCVADLKLGTRSFEVTVPAEKKKCQLSHITNTTTETHAIRCIDICVRKDGHVVKHSGKQQGLAMTITDLKKTLQAFLPGNRQAEFVQAIKEVKERLMQTQVRLPNLRLYSASVLAVYDGDQDDKTICVKLIDFAHAYIDVTEDGGKQTDAAFDDNSLTGLDSVVGLLVN